MADQAPAPGMIIPIPEEILRLLTDYERRIKELEDWRAERERQETRDYLSEIVALQNRMETVETVQDNHETRLDDLENSTTGVDVRLDRLELWRTGTVEPTLSSHTSTLSSHTSSLESLNTRVGTAEGNITSLQGSVSTLQGQMSSHTHSYSSLTGVPSTFAPAQHGNEAHAPDFAEATHVHSWDTIYGKPTEYPASNHGNERHNPDFVTTSEYSVHRHGVTVPAGGTWYDTTAPV